MIDSQIAGTGNSRYLKSVSDFLNRYPSYEAFVRALVAGTLPIDLNGVNPGGWTQQGTPLNKTTLLSDATAQKIGVADDATVNNALAKLFTFADDGKKACASAVSDMGVSTSQDATFSTIAANIRSIETGSDVSGVTATEQDVLSPKKFVDKSGILKEGKIVSSAGGTYKPYGYDRPVASAGRYLTGDVIVKGDDNLNARNIKKNVTIFDHKGTFGLQSRVVTITKCVEYGFQSYLLTHSGGDRPVGCELVAMYSAYGPDVTAGTFAMSPQNPAGVFSSFDIQKSFMIETMFDMQHDEIAVQFQNEDTLGDRKFNELMQAYIRNNWNVWLLFNSSQS